VTSRVSPSEALRCQIDELFATRGDLGQALEEVTRLSVRVMLQTALEAEVTELLGRERYARGERDQPGLRNGYAELTIRSTAGPITLSRPKLRGTAETFASKLLGVGVTRTNALESLVIASYVRGLSTRDVEATLAEALGPEATVSKSSVSRICEAIKVEFDAWRERDLSGICLDVIYLDGSHFKYHQGSKAEPVGGPGAWTPRDEQSWWAWKPLGASRQTRGSRS
jgi:putative transposase